MDVIWKSAMTGNSYDFLFNFMASDSRMSLTQFLALIDWLLPDACLLLDPL